MRAPPARCANALQARLACVTAACVQDRRVRDGFCLSGLCPYVPAWPRVRASWLASRDGFSCVPAGRRQCRFQPCYRALPLAAAYAVHLCRACSSSNLFSRCAMHRRALRPIRRRASSHCARTAGTRSADGIASVTGACTSRHDGALAGSLERIALERHWSVLSSTSQSLHEGATSAGATTPRSSTSGMRARPLCCTIGCVPDGICLSGLRHQHLSR